MARRPNLTNAQRERIAELREKRWTTHAIAADVGCCEGSVGWALLAMGVDIHHDRALPPVPSTPVVHYRASGAVKRFTTTEDEALVALDLEGLTPTEIGRRLGRRWNSVVGRMRTLARREARLEGNA